MRATRGVWLALVLACPAAAAAGDTYYMAIFGSQRPQFNHPKYSHSFAVFVRTCSGPDGKLHLEPHRISWLHDTGNVRVVRLLPATGKNFDLDTTFRIVLDHGERVSMWGPYQITPDLFERAVAQEARLESGEVRYKALDRGYPPERVENCMHAISQLAVGTPVLRVSAPGWGEPASYFITLDLRPWIIDPGQTHDWLIEPLGLNNYPICRRRLEEGSPTENPLVRAVQSVAQRRLLRE